MKVHLTISADSENVTTLKALGYNLSALCNEKFHEVLSRQNVETVMEAQIEAKKREMHELITMRENRRILQESREGDAELISKHLDGFKDGGGSKDSWRFLNEQLKVKLRWDDYRQRVSAIQESVQK